MKTASVFVLFLSISTALFSQTASVAKSIDSVLTQLNSSSRFNGTVLYAEKGKLLLKKAYGVIDFRTGQPLNSASSFNLASVSKQFVAIGILILSEKNKLALDDDVKKYIPELPYPGITIRNLLTHTSGIPEYFDLFVNYHGAFDTLNNEKLIALFAEHKPAPDFVTGTKWNYCNTNYVLLAAIIERISKQPLSEFINKQIVQPLGLQDTYVYNVLMPVIPANHVYGFSETNGKRKLNDLTDVDGVTGDGNIYSSVEDLYKWDQSLYTEKLVKKATLARASTPVKLKTGGSYPYGFGWFIDDVNVSFWHTGSWAGFRNLICRDTKNQRTLIVLSSGDNDLGRNIAKTIFNGKPLHIPATSLINHVRLADGTGTPVRNASVRIQDDQIIAVGDLQPFAGETVIDGEGKTLVPGFIDSHSHLEGSLTKYPEALAAVSQGVTTIVSGQDGGSYPIDSIKQDFLQTPPAINVATYTGQATLREIVLGEENLNRTATENELAKMKRLLAEEMKKGSLGLSTGLEYEAAFYSNHDEVIELAKVAAAYHGKYISHIRSEDFNMPDAIDEIINIGKQAKIPVQISHIKIALKDSWGTANALLAKLQQARSEGINLTADCYPYEYWNSTIRVLFPKKDFTSLAGAQFAVDHLFDPEGSVMVRFLPDSNCRGKTIAAIANMRNETPAQTVLYLVAAAEAYEKQHPDAHGAETFIGKSMTDIDVIPFLSWPYTNICSDGSNGGHPRGYGTFTRVLGLYVRDKKIMSFENAIHKMTALSAENVGIKNRGIIAAGYYADMVLLEPQTVKDNASIQNSKALSDGILKVWVNGVLVYKDKESTKQYPGKFLTR
jgi:N-acyl-D-aspartate/D-glutamate deacylase/CubicO group peptidase (beta-lactamase class C family)